MPPRRDFYPFLQFNCEVYSTLVLLRYGGDDGVVFVQNIIGDPDGLVLKKKTS